MLTLKTAYNLNETTYPHRPINMTNDAKITNENNYLDSFKAAVIDALEDIKGFDIAVMDVRKLTNMTSYMIVASATSSRQAKAMGDNVREKLKEKGYEIRGTEGEKEGEWVLVDLNDIIVHIMVPASRAYYNLEQLWSETENRKSHIQSK